MSVAIFSSTEQNFFCEEQGDFVGRLILKKGRVLLLLILFCALVGKGWYLCLDGFRMARVHFTLTIAINPSPKQVTICASERAPNRRGRSPRSEEEHHCQKARATRKIDLAKPQQADWHLFGARVNNSEDPFDPQLRRALSQKYSYLGRGRQCYAFESADGRYVLKLPRGDSFRLPFWLRFRSFSFLDSLREARLADKNKRFHFLMDSFVLASEELKNKTGLLYLHVESTSHLQTLLFLQDRLGRSHALDLDKAVFVLQEKKDLMLPIFKRYLQQGDREGAKSILESFMGLVSYRVKKGILNKDNSFRRNFGCDHGEVVQIDIGSFYRSKEKNSSFAFSFQQTMEPVDLWLGTIDPEMQAWFQMRIKERVQENL